MGNMINNERKHNQTAHDHMAVCKCGFHMFFIDVRLGPSAPVLDRQLNRRINVNGNGSEQKNPNCPKQWAEVAQMLRVTIDPIGPEKDLQVSEQVADYEKNKNDARDGDDHLFPDRRTIKSRDETAGGSNGPYGRSGRRVELRLVIGRGHLLPGFTAGMRARSAGNLLASNVSIFISIRLTNGQPKFGFCAPLRSTITPTAETTPLRARTILIVS